LKKIECVVRPQVLEAVGAALQRLGVTGLIVTEVMGIARQRGQAEPRWIGSRAVDGGDLRPKLKIEALVPDLLVDAAIDAVLIAAKTGRYGDGKVFVTSLDDSTSIANEERGEPAA
jgi:nitrogen regulatory protein P-II 1